MNNYNKTISALVVATALAAGKASAEVEYEIQASYTSEYLFRGVILGQDLVTSGVDVATEVADLGLTAGAWYGSFANGGADFDELRLFGGVSKDLGFASVAVGYISYQNLRAGGDNRQEAYFTASKSLFDVDFALTYFWDIEADNDGYTELAASKGFELSPCLTVNTGAALGYLVEKGNLGHLTTTVALDWAFTETASLTPFVSHSWSLEDSYTPNNEFVAGTKIAVSF